MYLHLQKKTPIRQLLLIMILICYSSLSLTEEKEQGWLKQKLTERTKAHKEGSIFDPYDNLNLGGKTCAEKDRAVRKMANGLRGRNMWGPKADIENISYGAKAQETLDVFYSKTKNENSAAPIFLMVHGGGWCIGDKAMRSVTEKKVKRWTLKGFLFISINYPMILDGSKAIDQAASVAKALAYVQSNAKKWGGDPSRIIMIGHSAGAHLVSLVNASDQIRATAGAKLTIGTIALDSAAIDVPKQMPVTVKSLKNIYQEALGTTESEWIAVSPHHQLNQKAGPWLGVCSTRRPDDPCAQAQAYAEKSLSLGINAVVLPQKKGHGKINKQLGSKSKYTHSVEKFMASLDPVVSKLLFPIKTSPKTNNLTK